MPARTRFPTTSTKTSTTPPSRNSVCFLFAQRPIQIGNNRWQQRADRLLDPNRRLNTVDAGSFLKGHLVPMGESGVLFRAAIGIIVSRDRLPVAIGRARQGYRMPVKRHTRSAEDGA